jgi:hypothetical protein
MDTFFVIDNTDEDERPVVQPAFDHQALIDAYRSRKQPLFYRLTDAGGLVWEQTAKPSWERRYVWDVRESASPDDEGECVVTAVTEEIARQAFLVTACGQNLLIVPGSERYVPCGRWNATYWKELDCGVRAVAAIRNVVCEETRIVDQLPLASQRRLVGIERTLNSWYAPVDEPDWQHREYLNYGGMWD